jgi:hypothetical protein
MDSACQQFFIIQAKRKICIYIRGIWVWAEVFGRCLAKFRDLNLRPQIFVYLSG